MAAEKKRGCGYRKIGGIYLCADGPGEPCHRLPIPLDVCPTCHHGVKQTRGWTWVDFRELAGGNCSDVGPRTGDVFPNSAFHRGHCQNCIACTPDLVGLATDKNGNTAPGIYNKAGLIWIGEKFYKTPAEFTRESVDMGVSRRITAVPKGFKVGEHFVLVAHPKAVLLKSVQREDELAGVTHDDTFGPGIFHVFRPSRIEKILADTSSPEERQEWTDRGFTVVLLPANDKDHQGTVYDKDDEEPTAAGDDQ